MGFKARELYPLAHWDSSEGLLMDSGKLFDVMVSSTSHTPLKMFLKWLVSGPSCPTFHAAATGQEKPSATWSTDSFILEF